MSAPLRTIASCLLALVLVAPGYSQENDNNAKANEAKRWFGTLDLGQIKLRLVAEVKPTGKPGDFQGQMISLDQNNAKLKLDKFTIKDGQLEFEIKQVQAKYSAKLNEKGDLAKGTFTQFGRPTPLEMRRVDKLPTEKVLAVWVGTIDLGVQKLVVQLRMLERDGKKLAVFDSVTQKAMGIEAKATVEGKVLKFEVPSIGGKYSGTINEAGTKATGTWSQLGNNFELELSKKDKAETPSSAKLERPQLPKDVEYKVENVNFRNEDADISLGGTLTLPQTGGPFPAVVLVSGSGPQDRDESLAGHKPFLVIADHLTRQGVAVLRYDDRGVGDSEGEFAAATTEDFASDAQSAVEFLRQDERIASDRIGIVGHSEGGLVATMLAASLPTLSHVVLLAGPGVPGDEILRSQTVAIQRAAGMQDANHDLVDCVIEATLSGGGVKEIESAIDAFDKAQAKVDDDGELIRTPTVARSAYTQMAGPWFRYFLTYDPRPDLKRAACPVLALIGEKDLQVLPDLNLPEIEAALAEAPGGEAKCLELEGLNHLFQTANTGSPGEYGSITETFSPKALEIISTWVQAH